MCTECPARPVPRILFLEEPAFIVIVTAAIEAYRRECYGALLGTRHRGVLKCRVAVAYQSARRRSKSVELIERRRRIIRKALRSFPQYEYLGEFHSHPGYGEEQGRIFVGYSDIDGTREGECELIMAVRGNRPRKRWQYCSDGTISGVAGGFFLKLGAYAVRKSNSGTLHPRKIRLRCAYAVGAANNQRLLSKLASSPGP